MLQIHIVAGLVAILAGFVALFSPKGQRLHRRSGQVLPVPAQNIALLSIPVLAVLLALIYWLVRLRVDRKRAIQGT